MENYKRKFLDLIKKKETNEKEIDIKFCVGYIVFPSVLEKRIENKNQDCNQFSIQL